MSSQAQIPLDAQQALRDREREIEMGYIIDAKGLRLLRPLSRDEGVALGKRIHRRLEGHRWALGDWLVAGGRTEQDWFGGSTYEAAAGITGYTKAHLSNCYRTCIAYPRDVRKAEELSFHVHLVSLRVADDLRLPLLKRASAEGWSGDDLTRHVNEMEAAEKTPRASTHAPHATYYASPKVKCPATVMCLRCGAVTPCGTEFTIKGHKVQKSEGAE